MNGDLHDKEASQVNRCKGMFIQKGQQEQKSPLNGE